MGQFTNYLQKNLALLNRRIKAKMIDRAKKAVEFWERYLELEMQFTVKTGRWYTRKRQNGTVYTWQASAPGEYPAVVTGELLEGIKVFWSVSDNNRLRLWVTSKAPHTKYLDNNPNNPHRNRRASRPLLWASKNVIREWFADLFSKP